MRTLWAGVLTAALLSIGCGEDPQVAGNEIMSGNHDRGEQLILYYGCHTCHTIPGVPGADGLVGPPLTKIARRTYLAGRLINTPDHMVTWLRDPQGVDEKTAMPNMGLTETDARDIASYLYTLQ